MVNFTLSDLFGLLLTLAVLFCLFSIVWAYLSFAPWLPSLKRDSKRIFKLADLKSGQTFYDLGCGTGKVVFYAAKHYPVKAIGLELALPFYLICQARKIFFLGKNATFKFKDLYTENLALADVIYIFGTPKTINLKLKQKLEKELKSGSRVISYAFKINDWTPTVVDKPSVKDIPIFLYIR